MFSKIQNYYKNRKWLLIIDYLSVVFIIILTMLILTTSVFASPLVQETATFIPTPTNITTPVIPPTYQVIEPTIACNPGGINNWGSVTPDAGWMFLCADCITPFTQTVTSTAQPTYPPLTQTAIALTGTPTTIPTATATVPSTLEFRNLGQWGTCTGSPYIQCNLTNGNVVSDGQGGLIYTGDYYFNDGHGVFGSNAELGMRFDLNDTWGTGGRIYYTIDGDDMDFILGRAGTDYFHYQSINPDSGQVTRAGYVDFNGLSQPYDDIWLYLRFTTGGAETYSHTWQYTVHVSPSYFDAGGTPTPTGTAVDSLCSQVLTPEDMNNISPFGFGGGNLITGQSCVTIPQLGIDITPIISLLPEWFVDIFNIDIPVYSLGFPRTLVCIRTTNYTIKLFYVTISTDVLISIVLFLAIIRIGLPEMGNNY